MAMEKFTSSASDTTNHEMVPRKRPIMPADLFIAAMQGKSNILVRRLELPAEDHNNIKVTIDAWEPDINQINEEHKAIQYNLESATLSGDTILHILIANRHNELAKKVFLKNASLLKAQNIKLETPLHYAAKIGNVEIVQSLIQLLVDPVVVINAFKEIDSNRNTTLHLAAKHGHANIVRELLKLNHEMMNMVNNEGQSPFHIAVVECQTLVVQYMLEVDNSLAFTQFSDGMFPIHVTARTGNTKLVEHLVRKYTDSVELLDQYGRNFFHVAAEENKIDIFTEEFIKKNIMHIRMINAKDYDGNTPLHVASMKGNGTIMHIIWKISAGDSSTEPNNKGLTPFDLSVSPLTNTIQGTHYWIKIHVASKGRKFTPAWFENVPSESSLPNRWERCNLIGLGSVLIATVAFATAFTIPGGYNADHGTPILGRRFMFRAFIISNAMSFTYAFISIIILVLGAQSGLSERRLLSAGRYFLFAANFMVTTFGTGTYVMLVPINISLASTILAVVLAAPVIVYTGYFGPRELWSRARADKNWIMMALLFVVSLLIVFGLAFGSGKGGNNSRR